MATKYFLEYKNRLLRNVGRTDTDSVSKMTDAFNDAMTVIASQTQIKSLQDSVTIYLEEDLYSYSLDDWDLSDLQHLYTITLNDGTRYYPPMSYVTKSTWDAELKPFIHTLTGKPYVFSFFDDTFYFAGVPDSSEYYIDITLSYWPAKVVDDGSLVDLTSYDIALEALATAFFWLKIEEVDLYDTWLSNANKAIGTYDRDLKQVIDFRGKSATRRDASIAGRGPDFWADPFRRNMP